MKRSTPPANHSLYVADPGHALELLSPDRSIEIGGGQHEGVSWRKAVLLAHRVPGGLVPLRPCLLVTGISQPEAQGVEALPGAEVGDGAGEADLEIGPSLALWQKLKPVVKGGLGGTVNWPLGHLRLRHCWRGLQAF